MQCETAGRRKTELCPMRLSDEQIVNPCSDSHGGMTWATDAVGGVQKTVRTIFADVFSCFKPDDQLVVEHVRGQIRIVYVAASTSRDLRDVTAVELLFGFDPNEMWIASLTISSPFRSIGLGRQLVRTAERIARAMKIQVICVFPLTWARPFWKKIGYRPRRGTTRVLWKDIRADGGSSEEKGDSNDGSSR